MFSVAIKDKWSLSYWSSQGVGDWGVNSVSLPEWGTPLMLDSSFTDDCVITIYSIDLTKLSLRKKNCSYQGEALNVPTAF